MMVTAMSAPPDKTGLRRVYNALLYSMHGLKTCFVKEAAFRQELYLTLALAPLAFLVGETAVETVLLAGSLALVLIVEILNSAVERAIDRISFDRHELSKEAKDMGSAAVFMTILLAMFTWLTIALPKLF